MVHSLFVYGTLQPGRENAYLLERMGGSWTRAVVRGFFYPQGLPSTEGYPALRLAENGEWVSGFVFCCDHLVQYWPELDAFEGDGYQRVMTTVTLANGERQQVFVYEAKDSETRDCEAKESTEK